MWRGTVPYHIPVETLLILKMKLIAFMTIYFQDRVILIILLPKAEKAKPKEIKIKIK